MNLRDRFFGAISNTVDVTVTEPPPPPPPELTITDVSPSTIELGGSGKISGDYTQGQEPLGGHPVTLYADGINTGESASTGSYGNSSISYTPTKAGSISLHTSAQDPLSGQSVGFGLLSGLLRGQSTSKPVTLTVTGDDKEERTRLIDLILEKITNFLNK